MKKKKLYLCVSPRKRFNFILHRASLCTTASAAALCRAKTAFSLPQ